jgi:phosphoribosyl 1,2-cyclic phosphate phosphodiesterase
MKITFLGTGTSQGVPLIGCNCEVCTSPDARDNRLRSSVMIEDRGSVFVIDTGPDFRQQMLRHKVQKLDAVVFTHEHKDHIAGLDDVRPFNYLNDQVMDVYATERVQGALKREYAYVFSGDDYPGIPKLKIHTIHEDVPFVIRDTEFTPIKVLHHKLPVLGFRVGGFTYITDANFIPREEMEKIRGSEVVVINALRREKHISHFTLDDAVQLLEQLKPKRGYLIHISHQLGKHSNIEKDLPKGIFCAYDGLELSLNEGL